MKINLNQLKKSFGNSNILVIGDIMLDRYIFGKSQRYSPEAPVPIINSFKKLNVLGGASNVGLNIKSLGNNKVTCCGLIGSDRSGKDLLKLLLDNNINSDGIFIDDKHRTTTKERIYSNEQQIIRIDKEKKSISKKSTKLILNFISSSIKNYDVIIISDYNKGVITSELVKQLIDINNNTRSIPIIVDPKKKNLSVYSGVDLITPNLKELENANDKIYEKNQDIIKANNDVIKKNNIKNIVTTLGKKGMIVTENNSSYHIEGIKVNTPDVIGAGDTVIATIALCLSSGMSILESSNLANIVASICVSKIGTSVVTFDELKNKIKI
jgi:D-glycero-beta-D-manno-heptose-7-phosphate kinase